MANTKKKFEACLLRTTTDVLIVAEWHQLVTTTDKAKLTVGSCVGYKESTKKREKVIRGTIVITGDDDNPKTVEVEQVKNVQFENKSKKNKTNVTTSNPEHIEENSSKVSRIRSEDETEESPVSKRTYVSLARFDEMQMENKRLKK
ncbi:unnamed protein product [Rotaria sordida]|uniref:Uncharacterized protein n=2 Tax=Rotaria sordida TaxID=392033 RepID=A0A815QG78_9BILA|nr:unnamed protein product [Rotaria sordida]